jgi:hypothetical protein
MPFNFIKKGQDAKAAEELEKQKFEAEKEDWGKLFRFFIKNPGDEAVVTLIDGDYDEDGLFQPPCWWEHLLFYNGNWTPFLCPQYTCPELNDICPIDESGDKASFVRGFTLIDHRSFTSAKGNHYPFSKKIMVAKKNQFERLKSLAKMYKGLSGATFQVTRLTKDSASIGDQWNFMHKTPIEELRKTFVQKYKDPKTGQEKITELFLPADFQKEITYRSGQQLRAMGLGKPIQQNQSNMFKSPGSPSPQGPAGPTDYSKIL